MSVRIPMHCIMAGLNMYLQGVVVAIPGKVKLVSVDEWC
jgi:hypothetical protein